MRRKSNHETLTQRKSRPAYDKMRIVIDKADLEEYDVGNRTKWVRTVHYGEIMLCMTAKRRREEKGIRSRLEQHYWMTKKLIFRGDGFTEFR